jgi:hypothetical protein
MNISESGTGEHSKAHFDEREAFWSAALLCRFAFCNRRTNQLTPLTKTPMRSRTPPLFSVDFPRTASAQSAHEIRSRTGAIRPVVDGLCLQSSKHLEA